jgi:DNA-binding transcriptional MerR regulator
LTEESPARSGLGVYGISVASQLSGLGPQTLRLYETRGLLTPARSDGGTRRYSDDDLDRLRRITELLSAGVNLAGVAQIFDLEARNTQLESANAQLTSDNARLESGQRPVTPRDRRRSTAKETAKERNR